MLRGGKAARVATLGVSRSGRRGKPHDRPALTELERLRLIGMIPVLKRHRWFRSMSSSQALTRTVFGLLAGVLDAKYGFFESAYGTGGGH